LHNLHIVYGVASVAQKSAIPVRTAPKPPPNFGFSLHLCQVKIHLHGLLWAIQIVANLDGTANEA
jgi:hypothetical protein